MPPPLIQQLKRLTEQVMVVASLYEAGKELELNSVLDKLNEIIEKINEIIREVNRLSR